MKEKSTRSRPPRRRRSVKQWLIAPRKIRDCRHSEAAGDARLAPPIFEAAIVPLRKAAPGLRAVVVFDEMCYSGTQISTAKPSFLLVSMVASP